MPPDESWDSYQRLVLDKLAAHGERLGCIDKKVSDLRVDLAALKIRAGLWGAIAGALPALVVAVMWVLK